MESLASLGNLDSLFEIEASTQQKLKACILTEAFDDAEDCLTVLSKPSSDETARSEAHLAHEAQRNLTAALNWNPRLPCRSLLLQVLHPTAGNRPLTKAELQAPYAKVPAPARMGDAREKDPGEIVVDLVASFTCWLGNLALDK
eukprot:426821-Amphidinium_carterae.1